MGKTKPVRNDPRAKRLGHGGNDPVSYMLVFKLSGSRKKTTKKTRQTKNAVFKM